MKLISSSVAICLAFFVLVNATNARAAVRQSEFINFGYLQNNTVLPYLQYEALTHIAAPFVDFRADGTLINPTTFTGRSSDLKLNGAASRAGTKVIACVRNSGFSEPILNSVMQDPASRTRLKNAVVALVTGDTYCAGVNFDFEFIWGTATRDGITAFIADVRAALPSQYEVSIYTHAIYNTSRWDMPNLINNIDYMLYSTYDWGTGSTPHANADFNNCLPHIQSYLDAGLPPEKMVLTWVTYGRRWDNTQAYNVAGSAKQSQGFYNGLYDTTLRRVNGGPFTSNYVSGDEVGWYAYNEYGTPWTTVAETQESLEYKIRSALSFPGNNGAYAGVRFGGVGWWSLMWVSNYFDGFRSFDPVTNAEVSRAPYYRHVDLLVQETLKQPGQKQFPLETFENGNPHWRDPNESPDTSGDTDNNSTYAGITAPGGTNRPAGTVRAGRLIFDFENASGNRAFLRHEILNNPNEINVTDTNAALALVSKNTRVRGHYYVAGNYSGRALRLALMDSSRQIEVSDPVTLPTAAGWHTFEWDFNDPAQVNAWTTSEPALSNGNGVVDTAAPGKRDVSFLGFIVEGGGAGTGTIYFDELTYEASAPDGKAYVINEFRYSNAASEFVEIAGPAGPFPAGMQLVTYRSTDGSTYKTVSLAGLSIPASGLFVIGDAGVAGASGSTGLKPLNWGSTADLPNMAPGALQLFSATSGHVYDSVVYGAFGGVKDLARAQTRQVTGEGYGWIGSVGAGLTGDGQPYTMGRMPDGADTNINQQDFSSMPPTPGQANGATGLIDTLLDFSAAPPSAFQTHQSMKLVTPASGGLPASPGGGNVYRCVDTTGGGVVGVFGDALMGSERGLDVTGQLYIPSPAHPAQAIAVGFCGTQGSSFFSNAPGSTGYDNGYWLIYENGITNLADGQPNHAQQFQVISASNDNQDSVISDTLGSNKSLSQVSAAANTWVTFHLRVNPAAAAGEQLIVQINNIDVYRGPVPAGGPAAGAVMVGHRESGGGVQAMEGTWVDDLKITYANPPAGIEDFELY